MAWFAPVFPGAPSMTEIRVTPGTLSPFVLRYPLVGTTRPNMPFHAIRVLEIAAGAVVVAGVGAAGAWMFLRKRPSPQ